MRQFFPEGPTKDELKRLQNEVKYGVSYGLFISDYQFSTFEQLQQQAAESVEQSTSHKAKSPATHQPQAGEATADAATDATDATSADESATLAAETERNGTDPHEPIWMSKEQAEAAVKLFSMATLRGIHDSLASKYRDEASRDQLKERLDDLCWRTANRKRAVLPTDWAHRLDQLAQRYPNFQMVVEHIRVECQLAAFQKPQVLRLPPLLLAGEPGIGKTAFARDLAKLLECGFFSYSLETAQHGAALCGSSRHWGNTRTGLVFDALADGDTINPVFLIDELDKASTDPKYDPAAPFYQLLERKQAAVFCDESIPDLPIDASHITWLFTANDITKVPAPILNRLMVFEVPRPTPEQGLVIMHTLFDETKAELLEAVQQEDAKALLANMTLSSDALGTLAQQSVRQAKIKLRSAMATAMARRHSTIRIIDVVDLAAMTVVVGEAGVH